MNNNRFSYKLFFSRNSTHKINVYRLEKNKVSYFLDQSKLLTKFPNWNFSVEIENNK